MPYPHAVVEQSVCWDHARIGAGASVRQSILGKGAVVLAGADIEHQSIIAP